MLRDNVKEAILTILDESFLKVQGYYLDGGTSLLETLQPLTAQEVSVPVSEAGASIAGHVAHVRFYLALLTKELRGEEVGKVDWEQSWLVHTVTPDQWKALCTALREAYEEVRGVLEGLNTWEGKEDVQGGICAIAHTAYHLGAIRLAIHSVQSAGASNGTIL